MEYTENFQQFYMGFCWLPFCKILPHKNILYYNLCYFNLLKIVPLIQEENEGFVHHMVMYECFGNFTEKDFDEGVSCTSRANMPYQKCRRYAMVAAWAIGGQVKYSLISNWQQFSIICTPIDHRNDVKMLKTQPQRIEHFVVSIVDKSKDHEKLLSICFIKKILKVLTCIFVEVSW